jgi:chromosome segregation ATPase
LRASRRVSREQDLGTPAAAETKRPASKASNQVSGLVDAPVTGVETGLEKRLEQGAKRRRAQSQQSQQPQKARREVIDSAEPDFAHLESAVRRLVSQQRAMLRQLDARATELESLRGELAEREARVNDLEDALDDAGERRAQTAERLDAMISHLLELEGRVEQLGTPARGSKVRSGAARGGAASPSPA